MVGEHAEERLVLGNEVLPVLVREVGNWDGRHAGCIFGAGGLAGVHVGWFCGGGWEWLIDRWSVFVQRSEAVREERAWDMAIVPTPTHTRELRARFY